MLLLVALAVGSAIVVARSALHAQLDERLEGELHQEVEKFRDFARDYRGAPDVAALLTDYLRQKVPDENETFFSIVDGRAHRRTAGDAPARLDADRPLVERLASARVPAYGWADTSAGRVRYTVSPVRIAADPRRAQLVAVQFRDRELVDIDRAMHLLILVGVGALIGAAGLGWVIAGRVLAPVREVRIAAEAIDESDLTRRIAVHGNDDVAQLARTFNRMLDRLHGAFTAQRRFLDDAGHELRTPITVIRGHLELLGDDPVERSRTRALVMSELDRMKRIVDDLLLLAKAERPDFLRWADVELAELTVELVATARVLGERSWRIDAIGEGTIRADGERLTQALMQLIDNAVAHTGEGDVIAVGSAVDAHGARLWVRDTGPGIPVDQHRRIFERFGRAEPRSGRDGTGLGLAIVASIARAHGGDVRVDSAVGDGATFTLHIPVGPPHGGGAGS